MPAQPAGPGCTEQPEARRCWEVELQQGIILGKGKLDGVGAGQPHYRVHHEGNFPREASFRYVFMEQPQLSSGPGAEGDRKSILAKYQSGSQEMQPPGPTQTLLIMIVTFVVHHVHKSLQNPFTSSPPPVLGGRYYYSVMLEETEAQR